MTALFQFLTMFVHVFSQNKVILFMIYIYIYVYVCVCVCKHFVVYKSTNAFRSKVFNHVSCSGIKSSQFELDQNVGPEIIVISRATHS